MTQKILSYSVKVLKLSAWFSAIAVLIIALVVMFFVTFPSLIKIPIATQLSELGDLEITLSDVHFDFKQGYLFLQIDGLNIDTPKQTPHRQNKPIATIDHLKWKIRLNSLINDIYSPSKIFIDTLVFYPNTSQLDVNKIRQLVSPQGLESLDFLKSLSINKTLIKGGLNLEIAPMLFTHDKAQLSLKITGQTLGFGLSDAQLGKIDIVATLMRIQSEHEHSLILPIVISNKDLSINSTVKFSHQEGNDFVELESYIERMQVNNLAKYLPLQWVGDDTYAWIKRGFIAGTLQHSKLHIKKNLSTTNAIELQFSTQLKEMELLFNSGWKPLKQLNASLETDGKKIQVIVHDTKLNEMTLNAIKVQIKDISQENLEVEVMGKINTQSERLLAFLKHTPLSKEVSKTLNQFSLSGKVNGNIQLVIPLDERASKLDIDLTLKDNRLSVLEGAVVVEDYNSKLLFHHNEITATGVGNIRGMPFDIRINPNNRNDDDERTFGVELVNNNAKFKTYITKQLDQSWRARIESESVKGNIAVILNEDGIPIVQLLGVQITTLDAIKGDWKISPQDFPSMHLSTKDIYINENVLPNFSAELTSKGNVLVINDLKFEGFGVGSKALSFQGAWDGSKTRLHAKAKDKGLTEFLEKLKVKEKVTGGEFDFDVHLACECAPWNMNYQYITGHITMNVKEGVFTDKDPNIGRILSLLNIKSIAKRLKLNLSDVTNKGFTYDNITTKIHLQDAKAKIEYFNLEASSSSITLSGQSNIVDKQYDLVAKVTPAIGDAVPIATYLAGGGLVGLGVWLVDEALFDGKIINKFVDGVAEFEYKITGPWSNPVIKKIQ
ncbi:FIG006388: Possible exported protein [Bathymodiolus heckerae thiotrophic gill symbiont]|uniref:YhdP family protein n=1 Tax=Bathymodiolus heckerae thiotrophic gill symbiont TaxID=1052212 RepID=UPI0010B6E58D|nr:DUF3971 domain-containing protein [Bathymodiolus heckerae thiotrophic gill symbiont]SMN12659.1 FIG006388: Possible exported protein [Bathymodiolus heckerae thiotrophic gill symbiont]